MNVAIQPAPHNVWLGIWRVADPKITLASAASLIVGLSAAAHEGAFSWTWAAATVVAIFFFEAAKNASGELFDWDSGADMAVEEKDRSPFSGGKRVLVDGLMTRMQTAVMAFAFYALGALVGLTIVFLRAPQAFWLGVVGVFIAFFYHAPPIKLSYRGLGELAVAAVYGPLIASGAVLVQTGELRLVAPSLPLGLLIGAFLWINEFPDASADARAGKRTLVVRLGKERAARVFALILFVAFAWLALLPAFGAPRGVLLGLIGAPTAILAARRLRATPNDTARIVPAQGWTLLSFVLYAVGVAIGTFV